MNLLAKRLKGWCGGGGGGAEGFGWGGDTDIAGVVDDDDGSLPEEDGIMRAASRGFSCRPLSLR